MDSLTLAATAASVANEVKAKDITMLDLRGITLIADYFVLCSASTSLQARAIADRIQERLEAHGIKKVRPEGYQTGTWILLDYGEVVIHIFRESEREFYDLERFWGDAKPIKLFETSA